jgi:hypothetical protein
MINVRSSSLRREMSAFDPKVILTVAKFPHLYFIGTLEGKLLVQKKVAVRRERRGP